MLLLPKSSAPPEIALPGKVDDEGEAEDKEMEGLSNVELENELWRCN